MVDIGWAAVLGGVISCFAWCMYIIIGFIRHIFFE